MLVQFFPRMHRRYSSLRLLGPILGDFAGWLHERGYPRVAVRRHLRAARRLEQRWHRRGIRSLCGDSSRGFCRSVRRDIRKMILISPPSRASSRCTLRSTGFFQASPRPAVPDASSRDTDGTSPRSAGLPPSTITDHLATVVGVSQVRRRSASGHEPRGS